jgi:hypothetical protein
MTFDERYNAALRKYPLAQAFDSAEDEFGADRSTEFLIAIVCDRNGVDMDDVISELAAFSEEVGEPDQ